MTLKRGFMQEVNTSAHGLLPYHAHQHQWRRPHSTADYFSLLVFLMVDCRVRRAVYDAISNSSVHSRKEHRKPK